MGKNATFQEKIQNNCEDNYRWKQTFQIDMAEMRKSNNYRYIFVLVDIYTLFLVATPLQNKSSSNVKAELEKVFGEFGRPSNIESDQGKQIKSLWCFIKTFILGREFLGIARFLKEQGVNFRLKKPPIKAAYVECMIYHLKRKLYTLMRHLDNTHWEELLPQIVNSMNRAKHPSLGGLSPINLTSDEKAAQIDVALNFKNLPRFHDFFFKDKEEMAKSGPLQVGNYVQVCLPDPRVRGFHAQVRKPFMKWFCFVRCMECMVSLRCSSPTDALNGWFSQI